MRVAICYMWPMAELEYGIQKKQNINIQEEVLFDDGNMGNWS